MPNTRKGATLLTAVIVGSFVVSTMMMGFAVNIVNGVTGSADPVRDEVEAVLNDLDRTCNLGTETRDTFDPGETDRGSSSELRVSSEEEGTLIYGEVELSNQDSSCESLKMSDDCSGIEPGMTYTTSREGEEGVLGCE